jgi:CRISPR type IV-associated protein Csf3
MIPLLVRARLATGVAFGAPWGTALDGLLASELHAARQDWPRPAVPDDLPLPLARCAAGGRWHWAATCAFPEGLATALPDVRYWTARVDERAAGQTADTLPVSLPAQRGRYRTRRMPLLVTVCDAVTWHAVGDPGAIRGIVEGIIAIGKRRSAGEGHVLAWEVRPARLTRWAAGHLHPDGTLGRPAPPGCLAGHRPVSTGELGTAGLRPPYMHPARQQELVLPASLDA